ncbi:MAG: hypothetical protein IKO42_06315 [Opitutales bacterium]|nr:hypothetical protein [Opitutales bacterium]
MEQFLQEPEAAFALFFGWAYIWVAAVPVFALYLLYKICEKFYCCQTGQD